MRHELHQEYPLSKKAQRMKKWVVSFAVILFALGSCTAPKPYYKTAIGKKKQKYYNAIQFGQKERPKKPF